MENAKNVFARRLLALRKDEKKTQKEIAVDIGVDRATLSKYEKGAIAAFDIEVLQAIARRFNVSIDYLIGWSDSKQPAGDVRVLSDSLGLSDSAISSLQRFVYQSKTHEGITHGDLIKKTINALLSHSYSGYWVESKGRLVMTPLVLIGLLLFDDVKIERNIVTDDFLLNTILASNDKAFVRPVLISELITSLDALKKFYL